MGGIPVNLIPASQVPRELWPKILFETHKDWTFLRDVPRWKTAYFGDPPKKVEGTSQNVAWKYHRVQFEGGHFYRPPVDDESYEIFWHPYPIPEPGTWWRGEPEFYARKYGNGLYIRRGYRWDTEDGYYQFPATTVKLYA